MFNSFVCKDCNGTGKDKSGEPCSCVKKSIEKPDLMKRFRDFDLKK